MNYTNGILRTYENNSISLSCNAEVVIKNGIITEIRYKGMPRTENRDSWFSIYKSFKKGQEISEETIKYILSYNGHYNIVSIFMEESEYCYD